MSWNVTTFNWTLDLSWHLMTLTGWVFWWFFMTFLFKLYFFACVWSLHFIVWILKYYHPNVIKCHEISFNLTWWHLMTHRDMSWLGQSDSQRKSWNLGVTLFCEWMIKTKPLAKTFIYQIRTNVKMKEKTDKKTQAYTLGHVLRIQFVPHLHLLRQISQYLLYLQTFPGSGEQSL